MSERERESLSSDTLSHSLKSRDTCCKNLLLRRKKRRKRRLLRRREKKETVVEKKREERDGWDRKSKKQQFLEPNYKMLNELFFAWNESTIHLVSNLLSV